MRGPNSRSDKGFTRELGKNPKPTPVKSKPFGWDKPVVKPQQTEGMATPHRLQNMKAVKPAKPAFTQEKRAHDIKKGR